MWGTSKWHQDHFHNCRFFGNVFMCHHPEVTDASREWLTDGDERRVRDMGFTRKVRPDAGWTCYARPWYHTALARFVARARCEALAQ